MAATAKRTGRGTGAGLGTFAGVFTPSVLTILGLVLFRRLGYVVGAAGVAHGLLIVALSVGVACVTAVSLAAIATNIRVKGGGDYYLISRSLGVEFGGAIGLVLYLAQSISIAFYCVGLGEALAAVLPVAWWSDGRVLGGAAVVFLFAFAWAGADVATRLQFVVMALLAVAIGAFFVGAALRFDPAILADNLGRPAGDGPTFWVLFAIFFPAVTGFTQGVSMSGDLRDPGRSLPLGTFVAVGVSALVYFGAVLAFGAAMPDADLVADYDAMGRVSPVPALVLVGLLAATLSSALASFLGAPRILQALAADRVFPLLGSFARGHGPAANPRRGVLLSAGIAALFVAAGDINFIAPVVSMFFLISYGLLNYATAFEARANSPSFRPRFRWFHYRASLLGAIACFAAMVMISPVATAVAGTIMFGLYQYIDRIGRPEAWADSKRDHYLNQLRRNLLAIARERPHPRSWRPRILAFTADRERRELLVRFASWIEGGAGLTTVVELVEGRRDHVARTCAKAEEQLQRAILDLDVGAFPLVVAVPDLEVGAQTLIQAHGVGPLRANIILLNWLAEDPDGGADHAAHVREFARRLRAAVRIGVNVVALHAEADAWRRASAIPPERRRIDVWWEGDESSQLMLLLAYMMTRTETWFEATIRVLTASSPRAVRRTEVQLHETLEAVRIRADAEAIADWAPEVLTARSADACVVFVPLRLQRLVPRDPFGRRLEELLGELPAVAAVLAAEDIDLEAEPDEAPPEGNIPAS